MAQQIFIERINKIMQLGLNLNVIDGMSSSQLRALVIEPETHIKKRLITSKNLIDERKQIREYETLKSTIEFKNLIETISKLTKDSSWLDNIELVQVSRQDRKLFVSI